MARFPAELAELMRHARRVGKVEVPAPLAIAMSAPAKNERAEARAEAA